jgi:hypothetical protein
MAARVRMPGELDFSGVDLAQSAGITGALILWAGSFFRHSRWPKGPKLSFTGSEGLCVVGNK